MWWSWLCGLVRYHPDLLVAWELLFVVPVVGAVGLLVLCKWWRA